MKNSVNFKAKSSLGFSTGTAIEDITDEKLHTKFVQKLQNVRNKNH